MPAQQPIMITGKCAKFFPSNGDTSPDAFLIQPEGSDGEVRFTKFPSDQDYYEAMEGVDGHALIGSKVRARGIPKRPSDKYPDRQEYKLVSIEAVTVEAATTSPAQPKPAPLTTNVGSSVVTSKDDLIVDQVKLKAAAEIMAANPEISPATAAMMVNQLWNNIRAEHLPPVDEDETSDDPSDDDLGVL